MIFKNRSRYNWREIFIQYGSKLASLSNREEAYKILLATIVDLSGAESASILVYEDDLKQYVLKEHLGISPLSFSIASHHPMVSWFQQEGKPMTKQQLLKDSQLTLLRAAGLNFFTEWHAEISFPLMADKNFLGVFNLGSKGEKNFDSEDIELFSSLISLGSVVIENSNLYETLLKQNRKLSEMSRLKTQFVSNITHELRTPIHGILGLADLLLEETDRPLSIDQRRYLGMIRDSGESLLELVDHILDLTKYQSGLINLHVKKINLKRVILEIAEKFQEEFQKQESEFSLDWPESIPDIYGDENEIRVLIRDLIGNAIKFTHHGKVMISSQRAGEMLKICVHDTGVGIDEADQPSIFEEFRQVDGNMNRSFGGSGLGLAIAKKIVDLHGGRIWVESKKGSGSYFYFTLPLTPSHVQVGGKTAH